MSVNSIASLPASGVLQGLWRQWTAFGTVEPGDTIRPISGWERAGQILFAVLLVAVLPIAVSRTLRNSANDFYDFHASGRYILQHGSRDPNSEFFRYLPSADVPWVALAWMPLPLAACAWYAISCWSWYGLLVTTGRYLLADLAPTARRQTLLATGLLGLPLALDGFCVGTFHVIMVWLMVAALGRASRGRDLSAGLLLGLAIWVKLLPAIGAGYLLLKRKWRPAIVAGVVAVLLDVVLSAAAYGPQAAWDEHVKWWRDQGKGVLEQQLSSPTPIDEDRLTNQSVAVTMRRLLSHFALADGDSRGYVVLADLSGTQLKVAFVAVMGLLAAGIGLYCRRPALATSDRQWAVEIALVVLATLWFSPVVWSYHPTAATPAMAFFLGHCEHRKQLGWTVVILWLASLALLALPICRIMGDLLWISLLLGAALVASAREPGQPAAVGQS